MLHAFVLKSRHLVDHVVCRQDTDGPPHDLEVAEEATPSSTQETDDEVGGATEVCSWFGMIDNPAVDVFLIRCSPQQDVTAQEANEQLPEGEESPPSGTGNQ